MRVYIYVAFFLWISTAFLMTGSTWAQQAEDISASEEGTQLIFDGLFQGRFTYVDLDDESALGFGVRRMHFRAAAVLPNNFAAAVQINARGSGVEVVDAIASYVPTESLRFRGGRFVVPQPAAAAGPPSRHIDGADRASIAEWWASEFLSSSRRSYGVDTRYRTGPLTLNATVHSGDGTRGNFRPSVWGRSPGTNSTSIALGSSIIYDSDVLDNLQIGLYGGYNPDPPLAQNRVIDDTHTLSAHIYWGVVPGIQPVRLKADFIRSQVNRPEAPRILSQGISLLAAASPTETVELFARGELLNSRLYSPADRTVFLTTGLHYSVSARHGGPFYRQRITVAFSAQEEGDGLQQPMAVVQLQLAF